jgi:hypothetical protein
LSQKQSRFQYLVDTQNLGDGSQTYIVHPPQGADIILQCVPGYKFQRRVQAIQSGPLQTVEQKDSSEEYRGGATGTLVNQVSSDRICSVDYSQPSKETYVTSTSNGKWAAIILIGFAIWLGYHAVKFIGNVISHIFAPKPSFGPENVIPEPVEIMKNLDKETLITLYRKKIIKRQVAVFFLRKFYLEEFELEEVLDSTLVD